MSGFLFFNKSTFFSLSVTCNGVLHHYQCSPSLRQRSIFLSSLRNLPSTNNEDKLYFEKEDIFYQRVSSTEPSQGQCDDNCDGHDTEMSRTNNVDGGIDRNSDNCNYNIGNHNNNNNNNNNYNNYNVSIFGMNKLDKGHKASIHASDTNMIHHENNQNINRMKDRDSISVIKVEEVRGGTIVKTSVPVKKGKEDGESNNDAHENVVLVCLLGWLGAKWKNVTKFSDWYAYKCHMPCLALIPKISSVISQGIAEKQAEVYVQRLEKVIQEIERNEYHNKGKRIKVKTVFHALSGNGVNMYGRIVQQISKDEYAHLKDRFVCSIVDSAPPLVHPDRFTRGFVAALRSLFGSRRYTAENPELYDHWILSPLCRSIFTFYLDHLNQKKKYFQFRDEVLKLQPRIPQLYIYGPGDVLVPPEDVKEFIQINKDLGIHVEELVFPDSPHVAHFKQYPEQYMSAVQEFIHKNSKNQIPTSQIQNPPLENKKDNNHHSDNHSNNNNNNMKI